ncbi:hypothetical protein [Bacteroides acidifaciens]|uniref:hypothetical protein n=1 Tax=Bacteroides acidifaciens TaxID=85831 RepID=UPI0026EE8DE8|nr:hypothetical protein [Bacteroides acidifaciens]
MMNGDNGKKTIVDEVKELLKDFDSRKVKAIKHLGDVSWVAKMMGCNDKIVTDTFNDASHEFSELDDKTRSVLLSAYADGMYSCKTRLEKGTDAFDRMRKFINGVTNCYATATGRSKDDITDTDKLFSVWMVQYIYCMLTDTKTADTFTASQSQPKQPKQPKDETKPDGKGTDTPVADTLFTKWASKLKTKDADTAELIDLCATELSMYVFENMSNDNAVGEVCAYAMPSDINQLSEKIAVALTGSAVDKILSSTNGFAAQLYELAKLVGIPSWVEIDEITKPDTTHDSDKYECKRSKGFMKKLLDDEFGGDVYKYLGIA